MTLGIHYPRGAWLVPALACAAMLLATPGSAFLLAGDSPPSDAVAHVSNGATPAKGSQTLRLEERWRAGHAEDDMIFGSVVAATQDKEGNIYLLDAQLSQVQVYSPDGEHLRTLSREGEGPGELRRPDDLLFMPDSTLGAVHFMTGSVVCFDREGIPGPTISFGGESNRGGMRSLRSLANRGGTLVGCAGVMGVDGSTVRRTQYLARFAPDGKEQVRYLEKTTESSLGRQEFHEKEAYFPSRGECAVGPDGSVYVAPVRDRYEIHVFGPDGKLVRVIDRAFTPRKRTQDEKDRVVQGVVMIINGRRVVPDATIEDYPPCILNLWVDDDGLLFVQHSNSATNQPDGVMFTLDVFDPQGRYLAEAAVACEGDASDDAFYMLRNKTAVLSRGRRSSWLGMFGGSGEEEGDGSPSSEVVCYRVPSFQWE